jgi:hypothetical protein
MKRTPPVIFHIHRYWHHIPSTATTGPTACAGVVKKALCVVRGGWRETRQIRTAVSGDRPIIELHSGFEQNRGPGC